MLPHYLVQEIATLKNYMKQTAVTYADFKLQPVKMVAEKVFI